MEPAPPARVVQRNDFNWTPPNGDPNDKVAAPAKTKTTTSSSAAAAPVTGASSSSRDEDLAGLGPEIEAAVLAKREYNEKFGAFRKRWTKTQFALADKAEKMRGTRFVGANQLRPIIGTIGVMFALGKAVDLAAFPGKSFGEFDEVCGAVFPPFRVHRIFAPRSTVTTFARLCLIIPLTFHLPWHSHRHHLPYISQQDLCANAKTKTGGL